MNWFPKKKLMYDTIIIPCSSNACKCYAFYHPFSRTFFFRATGLSLIPQEGPWRSMQIVSESPKPKNLKHPRWNHGLVGGMSTWLGSFIVIYAAFHMKVMGFVENLENPAKMVGLICSSDALSVISKSSMATNDFHFKTTSWCLTMLNHAKPC